MRCPICDGCGRITSLPSGMPIRCERCNGTGKIEQTEEEWFCELSTKEKAEFLDAIHTSYCVTGDWLHDEDVHRMKREDWEKWLKQPHKK